MGNNYRSRNWREYQAEIIELDGGTCRRCRRTAAGDGVVLQVHHKRYIPGRKPWEYPPSDCETLCKGCHAGEHGIIRPDFGWQYVDHQDLGGLHGTCERCGTSFRHEFYVHHEKWGTLTVGTDCCDRMTGTIEASKYMDSIGRKSRFVSSTRWKVQGDCLSIKQSGFEVKIAPSPAGVRVQINGVDGHEYPTVEAAKYRIFDSIDSGRTQAFFDKFRQETSK